jgi:endonuclease/exonuclease/phosphatase family metal-dependent hydrolase
MSPAKRLKYAGLALLLPFLLCSPDVSASGATLTVLTYNVENLFDDREDGLEYADYRQGRWTSEDYQAKLSCVSAVIASSCRGGPDIVALQEVENQRVLESLQNRALRSLGYHYAAITPPGTSPVSVAFLSRFPILRTHTHLLTLPDEPPLRPILEIEVEVNGAPLILFNNHWKSKTEGPAETEPARLRAAAVLRQRLRALQAERPGTAIVVLGDLNENVEEYVERGAGAPTALIPAAAQPPPGLAAGSLLLAPPPAEGEFPAAEVLAEPWYELDRSAWGSYVFQGRRQTPDHILLSRGCFDGRGWEYLPGSFRPASEPSGKPPRRYEAGGCSDHLPLLLVLVRR